MFYLFIAMDVKYILLKYLILQTYILYTDSACGMAQHTGQKFIFAVPRNAIYLGNTPYVLIYVINPHPYTVNVTINMPAASLTDFPVDISVPSYTRMYVPKTQGLFSKSGSYIHDRGILLKASHDVIVQVSNHGLWTGDGFYVLPLNSLGQEYVVASYKEVLQTDGGPYQIWIVGTDDNTTVTVYLACTTPFVIVFTLDTKNYYCGDKIDKQIGQYNHIQLESSSIDVSGFKVVSTKPVAVLSGALWGYVSANGYMDHFVDMLPPVEQLGQTYLIPPALTGDGYLIQVIGVEANTSVQITMDNGTSENVMLTSDLMTWYSQKHTSQYGMITASKPVLAVQFIMTDKAKDLSDPGMSVLRPSCSTGKTAILWTTKYKNGLIFSPMKHTDIGVLIRSDYLCTLQIYSLGITSGTKTLIDKDDYIVTQSQYLKYAAVQLSTGADGAYLVHTTSNSDIYVYLRAYKWAESYVSTAAYMDNIPISGLTTRNDCDMYQPTIVPSNLTTIIDSNDTELTTYGNTQESTATTIQVCTTSILPSLESTSDTTPISDVVSTSENPMSSTEQHLTNNTLSVAPIIQNSTPVTPNTILSVLQNTTLIPNSTSVLQNASSVLVLININSSTTTSTTNYKIKKTLRLRQYSLENMDEFYEPIEAPYAVEIGTTSAGAIIIIFVVLLLLLDANNIWTQSLLFKTNVISGCRYMKKKYIDKQKKHQHDDTVCFEQY